MKHTFYPHMKRTLRLMALCMALMMALPTAAQNSAQAERETFTNPVLWADCPDPDVIRVGDYFYLVTTTMHLTPGAPVMRSKNLVDWEIVSYLYDRLTDTPLYDMEGGTVYGRGQWATSLRYKDGTFYAYFSPNDQPYKGYVYTSKDPAQGWTLHSRLPHFHDASLFFDDDGRAYIFFGTGELQELLPDLTGVKPGAPRIKVFERDGDETGLLEGSRVVKKDGKYYLLMISWPRGKPRRQVCYRADRIEGPYEKKVILETQFGGFPYVGQGTIVDDASGNWWSIIFQDRGGVGRVLTLEPCTWTDGWPILGDAEGHIPTVMDIPVQGVRKETRIVTSDDFSSKQLDLCWQWNHNTVDAAWSLTERPGYLRLKTNRKATSIYDALNTISQRLEGPTCSGTVKLDLRGMQAGDVCGVAAMNGHSGVLSVRRLDKKKFSLSMTSELVNLQDPGKRITGVEVTKEEEVSFAGTTVYLRIEADFRPNRDIATFSYSLDGKQWNRIGGEFKMRFDYTRFFMGTRFAIFNYATQDQGGYVDVDRFDYYVDPK